MKTSSLLLLDSTAAGVDVIGTPVKAASYYSSTHFLQTVSYFVQNFVGTIYIEATQDVDSATTNYEPIFTLDSVSALTNNDFVNLEGKYTWIRVRVINFTGGSITKILLSY